MASSARSTTEAVAQRAQDAAHSTSVASSSFLDSAARWYNDNKVAAWTIAGVTVVVAGGTVYYLSSSSRGAPKVSDEDKKAKRRKGKKDSSTPLAKAEQGEFKKSDAEAGAEAKVAATPKAASVESEPTPEPLPQVTEESIVSLSEQERKDYAAKLKAAGNKAYGGKDYNRAIVLYGQAILCKADPVFYSNRAACYNALSDWDKVIEDTTAAINLDPEYEKALNRRGNAYEQTEQYSEALLDYTASCIIGQFRNEGAAQAVERLLKKVAESKAKVIMQGKEKKLPSPTFVSNYLQSFRPRPLPEGLTETDDLEPESGKWFLRKGLLAVQQRTGDGYAEAASCFDEAIERDHLDKHEFSAYAYNLRGTFRYLKGDNEAALEDLNKSIELDPALVQSYVKRASMHLEQGKRDEAAKDFELAMERNAEDPDIFYHRAQLHFILSEFKEAATVRSPLPLQPPPPEPNL